MVWNVMASSGGITKEVLTVGREALALVPVLIRVGNPLLSCSDAEMGGGNVSGSLSTPR